MNDPPPDQGFACLRCQSQSYTILFRDGDRLYRTTSRTFSIIECSRCALIRLFPRPTPDELTSFSPEESVWKPEKTPMGRLMEFYRRLVLWEHARFIVNSSTPPGAILDFSSGGGVLAEVLRRHGLPAVALDRSPSAARRTAAGGVPSVCAALRDAPFKARSLAAVSLLHVLEYIADPEGCLLEIRRLLRSGGRLFVQVPNAASWQFLLLGRRWSALDIPRRLVHFRVEDLEDLLSAYGFRVVRRKFFSWRDSPASLATSLCPIWDPVVRRARKVSEPAWLGAVNNFLYLGTVVLSLPFALWEAAAKAGSTVLVEAALIEDE